MTKEENNRQYILMALADNLQDTMNQITSIMNLISENSLRIKRIGEEMTYLTKEFLDISNNQIEINGYINTLVSDIEDRAKKLKENTILLCEECNDD